MGTTLTDLNVSATYARLLQVSNSNAGVDGTLRDVEDGDGTASALQISSAAAKVNGTFEVTGAFTGMAVDTLEFDEESADPSNPAEGDGQIWQSDGTGTGADGDLIYERQAAASTWYCNMTDQSRRGTMWHIMSKVTVGNAIARTVNSSQRFYHYGYQSAAATGDTFTHGVYLRKGTYTFKALGVTDSDHGQVDWTIDGVSIVANQDCTPLR